MKRFIFIIVLGLLIIGCKKNDQLTVDRSVNSGDLPPQYVFDVQDITGKDSVSLSGTVNYQVYLKQQDFYQSGQKYTLTWVPSDQQLDGTLTVNKQAYRQGEIIAVSYDDIKSANVFNVMYKPFSARIGSYELDFTLVDRSGNAQTKKKKIKIY